MGLEITMDSQVYQLNGTERKEVQREKIPSGDAVQTSYYDLETGTLLRRDVNIEVSEEFMKSAGFTSGTGFGR
jgi:hypothetical protein